MATGAALLSLLLAACSESASPTGSSSTSASKLSKTASANPGGSEALALAVNADAVSGHVHNLAIEGADVLLGTHEGLFRQSPGQPVKLISAQPFDVMGLVKTTNGWLASGHPGSGMDGPSDLGLLESTDGGVRWVPKSLYGQVDFHRLTASGTTVMGLSAHDGALLRSSDNGITWTNLGEPPLFDLAINPLDSSVVVGTTPEGPIASKDGGKSFESITGAPLVALLAWFETDLYAVDPTGRLHVSIDNGATWTPRGVVPGPPTALAASDGHLAILSEGTVYFSNDFGGTFSPRITGLATH